MVNIASRITTKLMRFFIMRILSSTRADTVVNIPGITHQLMEKKLKGSSARANRDRIGYCCFKVFRNTSQLIRILLENRYATVCNLAIYIPHFMS